MKLLLAALIDPKPLPQTDANSITLNRIFLIVFAIIGAMALFFAVLAASSVVAIKGWYDNLKGNFNIETLKLADNLVYIGFSFLTLPSPNCSFIERAVSGIKGDTAIWTFFNTLANMHINSLS